MTKAEEIVHVILNYADTRISNNLVEAAVKRVQDIIDRKCIHPKDKVTKLVDWKGMYECECGVKVVPKEFEAVR